MKSVNIRYSKRQTQSLMSQLFTAIEGVSSDCSTALASGDPSLLPENPDPSEFSDWESFFSRYAASECFSKYDAYVSTVDRRAVALEKFRQSEEVCRTTNKRLSKFNSTCFSFQDEVPAVIHSAVRKIERALGEFSWDEAFAHMGFGPGASVGVPRKRSHPVYKFGVLKPTVTGECAGVGRALFRALPLWLKAIVPDGVSLPEQSIVPGNRITTVPKNSKTERVIAIEPLMNMFVQKGIGGVIRNRLRRQAIDLNDQTRNQALAREGSVTGLLTTLDLSAASDSIATSLVELLVPEPWVTAMKICRSRKGVLQNDQGDVVENFTYEKFSSMGNGFTFELESLLFWALVRSAVEHRGLASTKVSVYGDDLIFPAQATDLVCSTLEFCGFKVNTKKSHSSGPFRESCGKHYFRGVDVSPFYIKRVLESPHDIMWFANSVKHLAHRFTGLGWGCDSRFRSVYENAVRLLPHSYRKLSVPVGYGDGGLVRDFDEARPHRHRCFDAYVTHHSVRRFSGPFPSEYNALCYSLMKLERAPSGSIAGLRPEGTDIGRIPVRYRVETVKLLTTQWEGLGPWV